MIHSFSREVQNTEFANVPFGIFMCKCKEKAENNLSRQTALPHMSR